MGTNSAGPGVTILQLNSNSVQPLYLQLKQHIRDDINAGKYQHGQQLPTEAELCDMYGVSRITTRRAITELVEEGVLYRQQGKGTFVTGTKVTTELVSVSGFTELGSETGKRHSTRVLSTSIVPADDTLAKSLRVDVDDSLLCVNRLFYIEDDPFILETSHYPMERFPGFDRFLGESVSTHEVLRERFGSEATSQERIINVIMARQHEANLLNINPGDTLYEMYKIVYDQNNVPMHTSLLLLATNKVTLTVQRVYRK